MYLCGEVQKFYRVLCYLVLPYFLKQVKECETLSARSTDQVAEIQKLQIMVCVYVIFFY